MNSYILGIDQSTQGTKILLFAADGSIVHKAAKAHRQYINDKGWVEHDPEEIWQNVRTLVSDTLQETGVCSGEIKAIGISNQRETAAVWQRSTGRPLGRAIVWQCPRGEAICEQLRPYGQEIQDITGLPLSPYFSAAKFAWALQNMADAADLMKQADLCLGTMDSWLVYKMTAGKVFATDFSNASRTQLFDIDKLCWSEKAADIFGIRISALAEVRDSNGFYGKTDFDGVLAEKVPIRAVLGDSHAALFAQGCYTPGTAKATYGTGSSVMMNVGSRPVRSHAGLAASLAWSISGKPSYVLEGNINYTGAAVTWLKDDLQLILSPQETSTLAAAANPQDHSYFVPAFTGLGAPYWASKATGIYTGITRTTGKKEMVRAVLDAIAYQINDVVSLMERESGYKLSELRVDGGPTGNAYLMQFQADMLNGDVKVPELADLSAAGAAYAAGISAGVYDSYTVMNGVKRVAFHPHMQEKLRTNLLNGWKKAIEQTVNMAS